MLFSRDQKAFSRPPAEPPLPAQNQSVPPPPAESRDRWRDTLLGGWSAAPGWKTTAGLSRITV